MIIADTIISAFFEMNNKLNMGVYSNIKLNNAEIVLEDLRSQEKNCQEQFLTMVQGNTFGGVDITDSNIRNNSHFIVDLWD